MITTKFNIKENPFLSTEDFQKIYNRKPEKLKISMHTRERDYHEYARGTEAFFGDNNEYKITMVALMSELRAVYQEAVSNKNNKKVRTEFSKKISPILKKMEKCVEKTFNISRCYFGLIDDLNAWCIPMCFDADLVTKKNGHTHVNEKLKVSLEDIVETKNGYKYKTPNGKIYCVSFGIHFLDKKNGVDLFTDEECAAIMTHEFGHAMQHAICSINENLASVYIHSLFEDVYNLLNPIVMIMTLGLSGIAAIFEHKTMKDIKEDDPEYIGDQIIKTEIGNNKKDYDRQYFGEMIDTNTHDVIKELPKKKDHKILNFFSKFISFTIGGLVNIIGEVIYSVLSSPSNLYALAQKDFLNKNRRFEQFADIYTAAYALAPAQASALAKLGNLHGYKQDYGLFSLLNYVPVANIITGAAHYNLVSIQQLINGYPDMTGRMAAMYKSLKTDLETNKDLSSEDKQIIRDQIDLMNDTYNQYVYDWSPKGFVYAIVHKIQFKSLKNEKTDAETNVIEALKDFSKEKKFTTKPSERKDGDVNISSKNLLSAMLASIKSIKTNYGSSTKNIINVIEPELRKI
jgi:hypothetical protein